MIRPPQWMWEIAEVAGKITRGHSTATYPKSLRSRWTRARMVRNKRRNRR